MRSTASLWHDADADMVPGHRACSSAAFSYRDDGDDDPLGPPPSAGQDDDPSALHHHHHRRGTKGLPIGEQECSAVGRESLRGQPSRGAPSFVYVPPGWESRYSSETPAGEARGVPQRDPVYTFYPAAEKTPPADFSSRRHGGGGPLHSDATTKKGVLRVPRRSQKREVFDPAADWRIRNGIKPASHRDRSHHHGQLTCCLSVAVYRELSAAVQKRVKAAIAVFALLSLGAVVLFMVGLGGARIFCDEDVPPLRSDSQAQGTASNASSITTDSGVNATTTTAAPAFAAAASTGVSAPLTATATSTRTVRRTFAAPENDHEESHAGSTSFFTCSLRRAPKTNELFMFALPLPLLAGLLFLYLRHIRRQFERFGELME